MTQRFAVELVADASLQQTLHEDAGALDLAMAYTIDSPEVAALANEELRQIKARAKKLEELRKGFLAPAQQIITNANALFEKPLAALKQAEGVLKTALLGWTQEQERIAEEARRKAQEEERARRQKAEQEAAAARAKAEEEAREQRRIAAEQEEARRRAEEEGNARAAKEAAAAAAKATAKADAAIENAEAKAVEVTLAAAATPIVEAPRKVEGFSVRENWVAEFEIGVSETSVLPLLVDAIAGGRKDLLALLKFDASAANKLAKALKGAMTVPGVRAVNRPVPTSRAA